MRANFDKNSQYMFGLSSKTHKNKDFLFFRMCAKIYGNNKSAPT